MRIRWISMLLFTFLLEACRSSLPDDLRALMELMNSNDQTLSVDASNKVEELYGRDGLLLVVREGRPGAKAKAARWLWRFPDAEVETAMLELVKGSNDTYLVSQALYSLQHIGTQKAVPIVEEATRHSDEHVRFEAREAVAAIRSRLKH